MTALLMLVGLLAGMALPTQAAVNNQLRARLGDPIWVALLSASITVLCFAVCLLILRAPWPSPGAFTGAPWWNWLGGLLGGITLLVALLLTPRLGAATTIALLVSGQLITSLVLDHWGLIGLPVHQINPVRLLGVCLLVAGVLLVRLF